MATTDGIVKLLSHWDSYHLQESTLEVIWRLSREFNRKQLEKIGFKGHLVDTFLNIKAKTFREDVANFLLDFNTTTQSKYFLKFFYV